jgi:hypothetical protein
MTCDELMSRARSLDVDGVMMLEFSEEEKRSDEFIRAIRAKISELDLYIETGASSMDPGRLSNDLEFSDRVGSRILKITIEANRYSNVLPLSEQLEVAISSLKKWYL